MDPNLAESNFNFGNSPLPQITSPKEASRSIAANPKSEEVNRIALNALKTDSFQVDWSQPLPAFGAMNASAHKFSSGEVITLAEGYVNNEPEDTEAPTPLLEDVSNHNKLHNPRDHKKEESQLDDLSVNLLPAATILKLAKDIETENISDIYSLLEQEASKIIQSAIKKKTMVEVLLRGNIKVFGSPSGELFIKLCDIGQGAYKKAAQILQVAFSSLEQVGKHFELVQAIVIGKELDEQEKRRLGLKQEEIDNEQNINKTLFQTYQSDPTSLTRVAVSKLVALTSAKGEMKTGFMSPFANGGNVDQWILTETNKTLPNKVKMARDMALALSELHAQGIVHRDIKPDNFLIFELDGTFEQVKICDFGKSSFVDPEKSFKEKCNLQMAYTPPEWKHQPILRPEFSGDVFQLGITLYQLFTDTTIKALCFNTAFLSNVSTKPKNQTQYSFNIKNLDPDPDTLKRAEELFAEFSDIKKVSEELRSKVEMWPKMNQIEESIRDMIKKMVSSDPALRPSILEVVNFFKNFKFVGQ